MEVSATRYFKMISDNNKKLMLRKALILIQDTLKREMYNNKLDIGCITEDIYIYGDNHITINEYIEQILKETE